MALFTGSLFMDLLGIATALVAIFYAYFVWAFGYWKRRGVPYLEPKIPFGNLKSDALVNGNHEIYRQMKERGWKHGGVYVLTRPTWVILDRELMKHVMSKDFQHFTDRGTYTNERDDPLSGHLVALGGKKWRNLRTKLTPTFTSGKMKTMFQTVIDCGLVLEKYIEENINDKQAVDIKDILGNFSTDVIGSCAFGLDCNSFKDPNSPFRKYGRAIFQERSRFGLLRRSFCRNYPDLARALRIRVLRKEISDFFRKIVADDVAYREKNNYVRNDFLQLLIDIKNNDPTGKNGYKSDGTTLTMDEIAAQSFVFFVAGFETSSTTMTFALYELASKQDIQDKVREEIYSILAKHNNQMTYDSLSELKYMKQVIDETLRVYSPIPFVSRVCVQDYKVPDEDVIIEKGTSVLIPIKPIHLDEEYYPNPEVFDPERFNEENKKQRPNYTHLPFGEGQRICIGERFGIMQTKVGLTSLLRKFRIRLHERTKVPLEIDPRTLIPKAKGGVWLRFEKL